MANNWLVFVFLEESDASLILEKLWPVLEGSVVLKKWHLGFDPLTERVAVRHLWVLLPALPFPLWNKDVLINLENLLGRFVALEKDFHLIYDKRVAKILVEVDVTKGLIPEIEIVCGADILTQKWITCTCLSGAFFVMLLVTSEILVLASDPVNLLRRGLITYQSLICHVLTLIFSLLLLWRLLMYPRSLPLLDLAPCPLIPWRFLQFPRHLTQIACVQMY